jgi:VIT1/CCC1 family predicted Fe2+/Mn2+ transporter
VWSATNGGSAQVTLRVPAVSLEEARLALRRMSKKVEQEKAGANDVTAQMVDMDAMLRNYRAEEQQYLAIMQRAGNVNDTLAVAQRLSDVRGRIERTQAQQKLMARQVEMATIAVSLRAESITNVQWMPNFREAWRDAAEAMAGYIGAMTALLLYAPVVLAWFFTVVVLLVLAWRTLRWVWTRWFVQVARAS